MKEERKVKVTIEPEDLIKQARSAVEAYYEFRAANALNDSTELMNQHYRLGLAEKTADLAEAVLRYLIEGYLIDVFDEGRSAGAFAGWDGMGDIDTRAILLISANLIKRRAQEQLRSIEEELRRQGGDN